VAAENAPAQVVIVGTSHGIDSVRNQARAQRIGVEPLKARWALHCGPLVGGAAAALAAELRAIRMQTPAVAVYSPLLGRYYNRHDTLSECIAQHLTRRIRFADAVRTLLLAGVETFVQCGPLGGLGQAIEETVANWRMEALQADDRKDCEALEAAEFPGGRTGAVRDVTAPEEAAGLLPEPALAS
jgi:acyl transferase domain-containing protein